MQDPVESGLFLSLLGLGLALQTFLFFADYWLHRRESVNDDAWTAVLSAALLPPLSCALWLGLGVIGLQQSALTLPSWFSPAARLSFLILGVWLLVRIAGGVEEALTREREQPRAVATLRLTVKIFQVFALLCGALLALQILGYPISALLTLGGVGGLVAGIAFRDILANFFAGLILYLDAPFRIGDCISVQGGAYWGDVMHIGWRNTEIMTLERRRLHIPNNLLITDMVENISAIDRRRIREAFGVRYQDLSALPALLKDLRKLLEEHPDIDQEARPPLAVFDAFADCSLNIMIDALARTGDWREHKEIRHDLFLKIAKIVHAHGADFAFPTRTLHIETQQDAPPQPAAAAPKSRTRKPSG